MSSPYQGIPANVTTPLAATITGATNATPIVAATAAPHFYSTGDEVAITGVGGNTAANSPGTVGGTISGATNTTPIAIATSAAHGLANGARVKVAGVLGNTAANGEWTIVVVDATHFSLNGSAGSGTYASGGTASVAAWAITVVDATHFSLNGSAGSGTYTSGGIALNQSLTPPFQTPSDGDPFNVSSVNAAFQMLADRTQALQRVARDPIVHVADLATLTAIATPRHGLVRGVVGFGVYYFDATSALAAFSPFVLAANDGTTGKWVSGTAHETTFTKRIEAAAFRFYEDNTNYNSNPNASAPMAGAQCTWSPSGLYLQVQQLSTTNAPHYTGPIDEWLVNGATLTSATLGFRPNTGHGALPTKQPGLAIVRCAQTGYNVTPAKLLSTPASGFAIFAAGNVAAYEAGGNIVFTADQNNVIDLASYTYYAIFCDESGTNARAGNNVQRLAISMSVPDARR